MNMNAHLVMMSGPMYDFPVLLCGGLKEAEDYIYSRTYQQVLDDYHHISKEVADADVGTAPLCWIIVPFYDGVPRNWIVIDLPSPTPSGDTCFKA
jgi:hypothetical protein